MASIARRPSLSSFSSLRLALVERERVEPQVAVEVAQLSGSKPLLPIITLSARHESFLSRPRLDGVAHLQVATLRVG